MQATDALVNCFGRLDLAAVSDPFVLFLAAAFFLLLGLGRLPRFVRLLGRIVRGESGLAAGEDALGYEVSPAARRFAGVVTAIAVLYVPAAIALGAGLTGEFVGGEAGPVTKGLELAGVALAFLATLLLFLSNHLARHPTVGGGLGHHFNDRPVLCTNAALLNRGTNRFEVVLVVVLALGFGGGKLVAPYAMAALPPVDCPPAEESADNILPAPGVARLPGRGADGTMRTREVGAPSLRLDRDAGLAFGAQTLLDAAPGAAAASIWLQLATLRLALPPELENRSAAALHLVRPALRPDQLFPQGSAIPPPDLFGTVAYQTRMAPPVWQVRVHSGYRDFGLCLEERGGCAPNAGRWADFVDRTRGAQGLELFYAVNEFVNASVRFQADSTLEDVLDDWVTPVSLISSGEGDCEDFALAKFWLLETLGVDKSDLYIVVVQDLAVRLPHAFLAVRHGDEVWLLDSRVNRPLSPDEVDDIVPVITIGDSAAYLHGRPIEPVETTPMSWLLRWLPFS